LNWVVDFEADRMVNSFISKKDLDSEFSVVRNEMEMGENDPFNILSDRVKLAAYIWHNYGNSPVGARSDVENVPIDRLQAFYKTYYQPDNAILLVAGKFDETKTLELITKYFGPIPRSTRQLPKFYTIEPVQDGERITILRRVGDVQAVLAGYHIPSGTHRDAPAIDVLTQILSDSPSGRLHKALIETKKAGKLRSHCLQLRDPGLLILGAEAPREASLDSARPFNATPW
jgi:zinc protease